MPFFLTFVGLSCCARRRWLTASSSRPPSCPCGLAGPRARFPDEFGHRCLRACPGRAPGQNKCTGRAVERVKVCEGRRRSGASVVARGVADGGRVGLQRSRGAPRGRRLGRAGRARRAARRARSSICEPDQADDGGGGRAIAGSTSRAPLGRSRRRGARDGERGRAARAPPRPPRGARRPPAALRAAARRGARSIAGRGAARGGRRAARRTRRAPRRRRASRRSTATSATCSRARRSRARRRARRGRGHRRGSCSSRSARRPARAPCGTSRRAASTAPFAPTEDVPWRGGVVSRRACTTRTRGRSPARAARATRGCSARVDAVLAFGARRARRARRARGPLGGRDLGWLVRARPGGTLRAGFDGKSAEGSSAGARMGPRAFGHLGFTGTSLWIDPDAQGRRGAAHEPRAPDARSHRDPRRPAPGRTTRSGRARASSETPRATRKYVTDYPGDDLRARPPQRRRRRAPSSATSRAQGPHRRRAASTSGPTSGSRRSRSTAERVVMRMPWRRELRRGGGVFHGGAIMALADQVAGCLFNTDPRVPAAGRDRADDRLQRLVLAGARAGRGPLATGRCCGGGAT